MTDEKQSISDDLTRAVAAANSIAARMAGLQPSMSAYDQSMLKTALERIRAATSLPNGLTHKDIGKLIQQFQDPLLEMRKQLEEINNKNDIGKLIETFRDFSANTVGINAGISNSKLLQDMNAILTGKNSEYQAVLRSLGKNKDRLGIDPLRIANASRELINEGLVARKAELEAQALEARLASESIDLSLPAPASPRGTIHPVSQVMDELAEIFADLGFAVATGPEIEDDWHNFTALNMPESHPARAMHDTFYFSSQSDNYAPPSATSAPQMLLRTHTSPVQIRTMLAEGAPLRIIAPGRVYRSDSDATHTPMFHQIEGLVIGKGIHLGHLKWTLETFLRAFFERDDIVLRLRPSYFPFTEPSVEVDTGYSFEGGRRVVGGSGDAPGHSWMELLGSGMVNRHVLEAGGLDPDEWQGFAFGVGVDRLAMLKYGMNDLRAFFDGDVRWLAHYGFSPLDVPTLSGGVGAAA